MGRKLCIHLRSALHRKAIILFCLSRFLWFYARRYRLKALSLICWMHPCLLLGWIFLGAALRFTHLASKSLWTDEFSTLVFSLGNSFRTVPLDQVISIR